MEEAASELDWRKEVEGRIRQGKQLQERDTALVPCSCCYSFRKSLVGHKSYVVSLDWCRCGQGGSFRGLQGRVFPVTGALHPWLGTLPPSAKPAMVRESFPQSH